MEEDQENEILITPSCPYCGGNDCEHVILDYDGSFNEWLSGYLNEDKEEIYILESVLQQLIKSEINPKIDDFNLEIIWNHAKDNYAADAEYAELDTAAYLNFLDENIVDFNGTSFSYSDTDGVPG